MSTYSERDRDVVWHPFTQMKTAPLPIAIDKGDGARLYDMEGKEYIDAISSWWVNVHGHSNAYIQEAVHKQLGELEHCIFAGFTHKPAVELAERIVKLQPFDHTKVFFSDNGSTAVEVGMKMALQYWWNQEQDRLGIVALEGAYHGDTAGAMSVGARSAFSTPYASMLFEVHHLPPPLAGYSEDLINDFEERFASGEIAAFIYEPVVQGAGGMVMYDREGMNRILALAKKYDVLLLADEVMTGFGRTATMFASEQYSTPPDIMTLSKALTGTMPLSLTTCKQFIYDRFLSDDKKKTFFHGHSYTGNATACAAAHASLDLMERPEYDENRARINQSHRDFAERIKEEKLVRNLRINGTIIAFEVSSPDADSYFNSIRDRMYDFFIKRGILLRPLGNTLYILPPFIITPDELNRVYQAILDVFDYLRE